MFRQELVDIRVNVAMSIIFISHSSKDNKIAGELRSFLKEQGHQSIFLDYDPMDGIPAGRNWEKELYDQLRSCRAMIVLCSEHSMSSDWCFAEITHAKSLGKLLFPLKVGACTLRAALTDFQVVNLSADPDGAYQRLSQSMIVAGLDPMSLFDWDGSRSPYPGLQAFKEEDAAIFFGRDDSIQFGLDILNRLNRFGGPRLTLILGSSGSGKSSLIRAGLVPRLKKDKDKWLVLDPFRPLNEPLRELALIFSDAFTRYKSPQKWQEIHATLLKASDEPKLDRNVLIDLAESLRVAAGKRESTVLLVIDQVEESLGYTSEDQEGLFLPLLRTVLETPNSPIMVIGTLRSDFLDAFQNHFALRDLSFESFAVSPLSASGFAQIIEGPAQMAGVELESGLVQAMVADTETDDALPLLAFTLSELWERYGKDQKLTLEEYQDKLGALEGSLARAAESVMAAETLSPEAQNDLRQTFISMVKINEHGNYARRPARWADQPQRSHALLERFVKARLLMSSGDSRRGDLLEVAHEALFRAWQQLKDWLDEDQDRIRLRDSLHRAAMEWKNENRKPQFLIHRDGRLEDLKTLTQESRFVLADGSNEQAYLDACLNAQQSREYARRGRIRKTIGALAIGLCISAGLSLWAVIERSTAQQAQNDAEFQHQIALSRQLSAQALNHKDNQLDLALLLSLSANSISDSAETRGNLFEVINSNPHLLTYLRNHSKPVRSIDFSPDGLTLASGDEDGKITLWDITTRQKLGTSLSGHSDKIYTVAWSPDGHILASSSGDSSIMLWDVTDVSHPKQLRTQLLGHKGRVHSISFSPDSQLLASGGLDKSIILWDVKTGQQRSKRLSGHTKLIKSVIFSPDGNTLASGDDDGKIILWDVAKEEQRGSTLTDHDNWIMSMAFSPDSRTLASGSGDHSIILWDVDSAKRLEQLRAHPSWVRSVAFSHDGQMLASGGQDGAIILWDVKTWKPIGNKLIGHNSAILSIAFSSDGHTLASGGNGNTVILWDIKRHHRLGESIGSLNNLVRSMEFGPKGETLAIAGGGNAIALFDLDTREQTALSLPLSKYHVRSVAFSPDGEKLASGSEDKTITIWDISEGQPLKQLIRHNREVLSVKFSADGQTLASGSKDGSIILWDITTGKPKRPIRRHKSFVLDIAFSPDAKWLATASWDRTARLWNLADAEDSIKIDPGLDLVHAIAFSPNGKTLALGSFPRNLTLWDILENKPIGDPLTNHTSEVLDANFSLDGKILATMGKEGSIILWDTETRKQLGFPLVAHKEKISAMAFSPNGQVVASGGQNGSIVLWDVDFESWVARACRIAGRNFTQTEWSKFFGLTSPYKHTCSEQQLTGHL